VNPLTPTVDVPRSLPPPDRDGASRRRTAERLVDRWPAIRPFALIGAACVVSGGLVAAVARPLGFALGSWLAAFLVLVGGVAQLALGAGQAWWRDQRPSRRRVAVESWTWNVGVAATIAGSLLATPALTTVGGAATAAALVVFLDAMRSSTGPRWALLAYRAVLVLVLVSTPVGLVLAWTRHA
jgi:hypothetical protein